MSANVRDELIKLIKKAMIEKNHTQKTIAKKAGMGATVVCEIFNGKRVGSFSTIQKLIDALEINVHIIDDYSMAKVISGLAKMDFDKLSSPDISDDGFIHIDGGV